MELTLTATMKPIYFEQRFDVHNPGKKKKLAAITYMPKPASTILFVNSSLGRCNRISNK